MPTWQPGTTRRCRSRPAQPTAGEHPPRQPGRELHRAHGNVEHISFDSSFEPVNPAMRHLWSRLGRNNVGMRSTGVTTTVRTRHCVSSTASWVRRTCSTACSSRCRGSTGRGSTCCCTPCPFTVAGRCGVRRSVATGTSSSAWRVSRRGHGPGHPRFPLDDGLPESTGVDRIAPPECHWRLHIVTDRGRRRPAPGRHPNVPVVCPEEMFDDWFPANKLVALGRKFGGMSTESSFAASAYHSPLNHAPLVPKDRRLIITGLGDRLAPPEQAEALWEHWDRCARALVPGNHILHVSQLDYLRRMNRFLRPFMFWTSCTAIGCATGVPFPAGAGPAMPRGAHRSAVAARQRWRSWIPSVRTVHATASRDPSGAGDPIAVHNSRRPTRATGSGFRPARHHSPALRTRPHNRSCRPRPRATVRGSVARAGPGRRHRWWTPAGRVHADDRRVGAAPPRRCHATAGRPNVTCSAAIFAAAETVKPIQVVCALGSRGG